ncbi:MvaI/BcnI restriction endonuclease family protein [Candidatus Pacearchaeota archaeon]|nr:MvaI/BcnI restriction endonuclease family protein [Candidatus Pacearchaeota archaeon]
MQQLDITKEDLIKKLKKIIEAGWVHTGRSINAGSIGNTLEDLLGIKENNFSIADTVDWELKAQRAHTTSLITLFHMDPKPRRPSVVANFLLPRYGWPHKEAGKRHPKTEMSFRATLTGNRYTDRGLTVKVDNVEHRLKIAFNPNKVSRRHEDWFKTTIKQDGPGPMSVVPYWNFDELERKCIGKIKNTVFVIGEARHVNGQEEFKYTKITLLEDFDFRNFIKAIISGHVFIDFDARTGHNHGTKFRIKQNSWPVLYSKITEVR